MLSVKKIWVLSLSLPLRTMCPWGNYSLTLSIFLQPHFFPRAKYPEMVGSILGDDLGGLSSFCG